MTETAVIRSTYVRWCGGTAAKAASYPISMDEKNIWTSAEVLRWWDFRILPNL